MWETKQSIKMFYSPAGAISDSTDYFADDSTQVTLAPASIFVEKGLSHGPAALSGNGANRFEAKRKPWFFYLRRYCAETGMAFADTPGAKPWVVKAAMTEATPALGHGSSASAAGPQNEELAGPGLEAAALPSRPNTNSWGLDCEVVDPGLVVPRLCIPPEPPISATYCLPSTAKVMGGPCR
jgi:hypothetical protein